MEQHRTILSITDSCITSAVNRRVPGSSPGRGAKICFGFSICDFRFSSRGLAHLPDRFHSSITAICIVFLAVGCAPSLFGQDKGPSPDLGAQASALPDATALLKQIQENQKHIELARRDYICRRKDVQPDFDSQGQVKSTKVEEYEVYFVGPWQIERLLSKNGKPLSDAEKKKQEEEVQKQERKARERIAKQESEQDPGKDAITMAKFLAADRFYNLRRDTYQGREVYAMDFAPRDDLHAHTLVDRVLKTLGGTLWVDEQARQIVRLEARFLDSLKVGGGILGALQKGGNVVLEQRYVNDEVWMPSYIEIHLNARVLFIHKAINDISTYSDFRKFRVNSRISGEAPAVPSPQP